MTSQRGFTLVELAVVLVIIALVVGGVLIGRDLIASASVSNFISALERYNSGAATFQLKYKGLPGDLRSNEAEMYGFAARTGGLGMGDGNGFLEGCAQGSKRLGCESALFWRDMWEGGVSPFGSTTATNIPVDGTAGGFRIADYLPGTPFRTGTSVYAYSLNSRNGYYISRISSVSSDGTLSIAPALTPQEARDVDSKMDDAAPDNGTVRAMTDLTTYDTGGAPSATTCVNNTLAQSAYNLIEPYSTSISCMLYIRTQF